MYWKCLVIVQKTKHTGCYVDKNKEKKINKINMTFICKKL